MAFVRKEKWTEAQWQAIKSWSLQPKSKSEKILTREKKDVGKRRRRIERIEDSRRLGAEFREVWE